RSRGTLLMTASGGTRGGRSPCRVGDDGTTGSWRAGRCAILPAGAGPPHAFFRGIVAAARLLLAAAEHPGPQAPQAARPLQLGDAGAEGLVLAAQVFHLPRDVSPQRGVLGQMRLPLADELPAEVGHGAHHRLEAR